MHKNKRGPIWGLREKYCHEKLVVQEAGTLLGIISFVFSAPDTRASDNLKRTSEISKFYRVLSSEQQIVA